MRRWVLFLAALACTPHGVEAPEEPEPEPPPADPEAPEVGPDGCDHDAPPWLTADVEADLGSLPVASRGPGIAAEERKPRYRPEVWESYVRNRELDEEVAGVHACRSQYFLEGDDKAVATRIYRRKDDSVLVKQDNGTDGHIDVRMTWTYDSAGALSRYHEKTPQLRVCGTKVPSESLEHRYIYDRFGMHIRTDVDFNVDGSVDQQQDWRAIRYDSDGLPVLVVSFDRMGKPRVIERFTWGDDARLVERTVQDGKGVLVEAERNDYDAYGQRRWRAEFAQGKGWRTSHLFYGDNGELILYDTDLDLDCTADERTALTHNDRGDLETATTNAGETTKRVDTYKYDFRGRLLRFSRREGEVNDAEFRELSYDEEGRRTRLRVRENRGQHVFEDDQKTYYDDEGRVVKTWKQRGTFGPEEWVRWSHRCKRGYKKLPRIDPRDDPDLAHYCFQDFE